MVQGTCVCVCARGGVGVRHGGWGVLVRGQCSVCVCAHECVSVQGLCGGWGVHMSVQRCEARGGVV